MDGEPKTAGAEPTESAAEEMWGTLEELLLASAVRRHGDSRWDFVAMEVRARVPAAKFFTAEGCERRYRLLQRRFAGFVAGGDLTVDSAAATTTEDVPWLDELRRLRVAELRREVQRYDVSIMSLQLKVKRLKEERERDEMDPVSGSDRKPDPEAMDDRRFVVGSSGDSCKESNSTGPKPEEVRRPGGEVTANPKPDLAAVAADEKSFNGSSEADPVRVAAESAGESKESSEVQSSASLSKRRRGGRRGKSVAQRMEPEADAAPAVGKRSDAVVKSEPLIGVLDLIRSSEHGAVFERRLASQESQRYKNMIRRHVDLETLRAKLETGLASHSATELFRDLHLLCANAAVFFPNGSPESSAAANIRSLVVKEMAAYFPPRPPKPPPLLPPAVDDENTPLVKLKQEIENDSLPAKKAGALPTGTLVACRKRISGASKAVKKEEKEKPVAKAMAIKDEEEDGEEGEEMEKGKVEVLDSPRSKRKDGEKPTKGLRTSKSRGGGSNSKNSNNTSNPKPTGQSSESKSDVAASKAEKKSSNANTSATSGGMKKANASSDVLSRAKQPVAAQEATKSGSGGRSMENRKAATRGDGRRRGGGGAATRNSVAAATATRNAVAVAAAAAEKNAALKRVGRPPKRAAAAPGAKMGREEVQTPPPARKRGRR